MIKIRVFLVLFLLCAVAQGAMPGSKGDDQDAVTVYQKEYFTLWNQYHGCSCD